MTKFLLIVILILGSPILSAQQILKCYEHLTDINLVCEYFTNLDSAFAAKNRVHEIKVTESYFNHGVHKYDRTTLNFKYDSLFKKSYSEINSWAEDGILSYGNVVVYYKDSIINSQLNRSSYDPIKGPSINNHVTKLVWLNDTLIKQDSYSYLNDSLYRYEDLGIKDTRAEIRENEKMKKMHADSLTLTITNPKDFIVHLEPDYSIAQPHSDIIVKDSLGRIIEIEKFFLTTISDISGSFPSKKFYIEYLDSTRIIKSIKAYDDFTTNKRYFEEMIDKGLNNSTGYFWPKNYIYNNLYFQFTATNFKFGIPQQVVVSHGKDATTQRIYKTYILTR